MAEDGGITQAEAAKIAYDIYAAEGKAKAIRDPIGEIVAHVEGDGEIEDDDRSLPAAGDDAESDLEERKP